MADLGSATLELKTDNSDLESGLKDAEDSVDSFGALASAALVAVGAIISDKIMDTIGVFTAVGDDIHKMALRTNLSEEFLVAFGHVMEQNGASVKQVEMGLMRLVRFLMIDLPTGSKKAEEVLGLLNMSMEEGMALTTMDTAEMFEFLIEKMRSLETFNQQYIAAQMTLGGLGIKLLPVIRGTAEAYEDTFEEGEKLIPVTKEMIQMAADLNDSFHEVEQATTGLKMAIGEALAPALKMVNEFIAPLIAGFSDWAKEHPKLTALIATTAGGLAAAAIIVGAFTLATTLLGGALLTTITIALPIAGVVMGIAAAFIFWEEISNFVAKAMDKTFQFIGKVVENFANKGIQYINFVIDGLNKLSWITGKTFDHMEKVSIDWEFTWRHTSEEVVDHAERIVEIQEELQIETDKTAESFENVGFSAEKMHASARTSFDLMQQDYESTQQKITESTKVWEKKRTDVIQDEYLRQHESLVRSKFLPEPEEIEKLRLQDIRGLRQQMSAMKGGISAGESMLIDDLKAGGKLQVSTGKRDERGGVIFRDATQDDMHKLFRNRIEMDLPNLTGLNNPNPADLVTTKFRGQPVGNPIGEFAQIYLNMDGQTVDNALGSKVDTLGDIA